MTTLLRDEPERPDTASVAARRVAATNEVSEQFFEANAESIALACQAMALQFQQGGRLLVWGDGPQRSDAAHVVVEFVHPVVVGKRALPAIALTGAEVDPRVLLRTIGRRGDILMVLSGRAPAESDDRLLLPGRAAGMLTLALTGTPPFGSTMVVPADFHFAVGSHDPCIVQETHEILYHVLWELVHVFFEHRPVNR